MPAPFIWFDNFGTTKTKTTAFFTALFGWPAQAVGEGDFLSQPDAASPFAAVYEPLDGLTGWVPYVEVDDLAARTAEAKALGAEVLVENKAGPAGIATFLKDPGGAVLAIWKRGEGA